MEPAAAAHPPADADPSLWNADLAPTPPEKRTWTKWNVAALWVGMAVCIPTYTLAASMIKDGMSVAQAILTVCLGNVIVLVPMLLNAHAGTRYGIPFPVFARAAFGTRGANVPAVARALVACGWFGIQTWIGGGSLYVILVRLGAIPPDLARLPIGINAGELGCFLAFWAVNVFFIWRGMESIKWLETLAAPFLIVAGLGLLLWARSRAGGFGPMFSARGLSGPAFWKVFWPYLTGMVGFWSTLALNIPDFSRYCRSQKDQIAGQTLGLPTTMTLFSFIGAAVTSATVVIFKGDPIWDPNQVVGKFSSPLVVTLGLLGLAVATLSTNIAANVVSPANDFSNVSPRRISYKLGGYITAGIGLALFPWKLMDNYVFVWLNGYGGLLGAVGGVLVADYWIVRRRVLVVADLYRKDGAYQYQGGVNPWALVALCAGIAPNVPGFLHAIDAWPDAPAFFVALYAWTWFIGFIVAGAVYALGMGTVAAKETRA